MNNLAKCMLRKSIRLATPAETNRKNESKIGNSVRNLFLHRFLKGTTYKMHRHTKLAGIKQELQKMTINHSHKLTLKDDKLTGQAIGVKC